MTERHRENLIANCNDARSFVSFVSMTSCRVHLLDGFSRHTGVRFIIISPHSHHFESLFRQAPLRHYYWSQTGTGCSCIRLIVRHIGARSSSLTLTGFFLCSGTSVFFGGFSVEILRSTGLSPTLSFFSFSSGCGFNSSVVFVKLMRPLISVSSMLLLGHLYIGDAWSRATTWAVVSFLYPRYYALYDIMLLCDIMLLYDVLCLIFGGVAAAIPLNR